MSQQYSRNGHRVRPTIRGHNSSGEPVSLLNDEPARQESSRNHFEHNMNHHGDQRMPQLNMGTVSSPPATPDLLRSTSYDSTKTNDPMSPITPTSQEFGRNHQYPSPSQNQAKEFYSQHYRTELYQNDRPQYFMGESYHPEDLQHGYAERTFPQYSNNYEDESHRTERDGKRFACRYKKEFDCNKTFTTSGHASRHAKIHVSEKSIDCTHPGCQKKFTRQDNMKQHLETHSKERTRAAKTSMSNKAILTQPAGVRKPTSGRSSRPPSRADNSAMPPSSREDRSAPLPLDPALLRSPRSGGYSQQASAMANHQSGAASSPALSSYGAFGEMGRMQNSLPGHSLPSLINRPDQTGIDTLLAASQIQQSETRNEFLERPL